MAYTGTRLEEASAVRPRDVREVGGVLCIEVSPDASQIKTENAARLIPVHSAIRDELRRYASSRSAQPTANLWGLEADRFGKWSAALSKRLNKRLQSAIPGKSKSLPSWMLDGRYPEWARDTKYKHVTEAEFCAALLEVRRGWRDQKSFDKLMASRKSSAEATAKRKAERGAMREDCTRVADTPEATPFPTYLCSQSA
jgi:hypothetical protein